MMVRTTVQQRRRDEEEEEERRAQERAERQAEQRARLQTELSPKAERAKNIMERLARSAINANGGETPNGMCAQGVRLILQGGDFPGVNAANSGFGRRVPIRQLLEPGRQRREGRTGTVEHHQSVRRSPWIHHCREAGWEWFQLRARRHCHRGGRRPIHQRRRDQLRQPRQLGAR